MNNIHKYEISHYRYMKKFSNVWGIYENDKLNNLYEYIWSKK